VFPVFPVDVPSLFPDSDNELRRFPVFFVFAIGTVSSVSSIAFFASRKHWDTENLTGPQRLPKPLTWNTRGTSWEQGTGLQLKSRLTTVLIALKYGDGAKQFEHHQILYPTLLT
jgi:hypothetical protein